MIDPEQLIHTATQCRGGLPRVDWSSVSARIEEGCIVERADLARAWLRRLGAALSSDAHQIESKHFLVLEAPRECAGAAVLRFAEQAHDRVLQHLRGIARSSAAPLAVLVLAQVDDYYTYVSDFYPLEGEFATSGGIFIDNGYRHIVLPGADRAQQDRALAHELTHAMVAHLEIPAWINEGMAVSIERLMVGPSFSLSTEEIEEHRAFWDAETIQEFWSGCSFYRPDDGNRLSYQLAEILVRTLASNYDAFAEFANRADLRDGGEAASAAVYGRSLESLPSALLGPGPWRPDPAAEA